MGHVPSWPFGSGAGDLGCRICRTTCLEADLRGSCPLMAFWVRGGRPWLFVLLFNKTNLQDHLFGGRLALVMSPHGLLGPGRATLVVRTSGLQSGPSEMNSSGLVRRSWSCDTPKPHKHVFGNFPAEYKPSQMSHYPQLAVGCHVRIAAAKQTGTRHLTEAKPRPRSGQAS